MFVCFGQPIKSRQSAGLGQTAATSSFLLSSEIQLDRKKLSSITHVRATRQFIRERVLGFFAAPCLTPDISSLKVAYVFKRQ